VRDGVSERGASKLFPATADQDGLTSFRRIVHAIYLSFVLYPPFVCFLHFILCSFISLSLIVSFFASLRLFLSLYSEHSDHYAVQRSAITDGRKIDNADLRPGGALVYTEVNCSLSENPCWLGLLRALE
jgi:hypothetical protein